MECERYQDCSWFHQDLAKESLCNKLLAESPEPIININELDLAMPYGNEHVLPKGEDYLEVFDYMFLEENDKIEKKLKNDFGSNEEYTFINSDNVEENPCDPFGNYYSLRKTDSFDNMELISSTNPAEIIPISQIECLNNASGALPALCSIKKETKDPEEVESSNSYLMQSGENDLNIGREEVVEEENSNQEDTKSIKSEESKEVIHTSISSTDIFTRSDSNNTLLKIHEPDNKNSLKSVSMCNTEKHIKVENLNAVKQNKLDLNLDLSKVNFEQSIGVNTPDLDFMDLVEFINEVSYLL